MAYNVNIDKSSDGKLIIKSDFSEPIILSNPGDERILTITGVEDLIQLNDLVTSIDNENNTRKLEMEFRVSTTDRPDEWSEWSELNPNGPSDCFPELTPFYDYNIEIKFIRIGSNDTGDLSVNSFEWSGTWNVNEIDSPVVDLSPGSDSVILDVKDTFKVFRLDGYELVSRGSGLNVEYRISQDNKRSWSQWTILNDDNLSTERIDPIRFFNIQYKFSNTGTSEVQIRDLNFYGEFINISENYTKSNLFGLREECKNGLVGDTGLNTSSGTNNLSISNNIKSGESIWSTMTCNTDDLFNPYKQDQAIDLFDKLSNDATEIGGWTVEYFRTEPDENGIDHSIHEYSLHGVVATGDIKIMVPNNQFPSNQIAFNQFDLALLESFEVQVTKAQFKSIFGEQFRPKKEDFLWFCDISRMYRIENAQAIRTFANSSVYYKLILGKYNQRADVKAVNSTIQEKINDIVKNSTLDDLFGTFKENDKKEVAYKDQHHTLSNTHEQVRNIINASVEIELIDNAELVLSKYHYNLSGISSDNDAVVYKKSDIYLKPGNNRSYMSWIKFEDYSDTDTYNLLNNYNDALNKGYRFDITGGNLITTINSATYSIDLSNSLDDNIWYCILVNIDQRQRKISHYLYKRNVDREIDAKNLNSTKLRLLESNSLDYIPNEYELNPDELSMKIMGSYMKITNIRVFDDILPEEQHTKIINQQIIRDSDHSILADNANKIYYLPNYSYHGTNK